MVESIVEIIAADGSVRWLVTSVSPPREMRSLPSKDWEASNPGKACLNFEPFTVGLSPL